MNCIKQLCDYFQRPGATPGVRREGYRTIKTDEEGITESSRSLKPICPLGRAFESPSFEYDPQPELLISNFTDKSLDAADNVVDLFKLALDTCEKVRRAIGDCGRHVDLPPDFRFGTFFEKIRSRQGYNVNVTIDALLLKVTVPESVGVPRVVVLACEQLNAALTLCSEFVNDKRHNSLDKDVFLVKTYGKQSQNFQTAVSELQNYAVYISDVKKQANKFIADFQMCA